jgi:hypothetical protein
MENMTQYAVARRFGKPKADFVKAAINRMRADANGHVAPFESTMAIAKWVQQSLDVRTKKEVWTKGDGEGGERVHKIVPPTALKDVSKFLEEAEPDLRDYGLKDSPRSRPKGKKEEIPPDAPPRTPPKTTKERSMWGEMRIKPIQLYSFKHKKNREAVATLEGSVLCYPHRYSTDRTIFRKVKRNRPKGTILVDQSGSMGFTQDDLNTLIKVSPMAKIATYSGHFKGGELRVVAAHGQRADYKDLEPYGGSNVVDGKALEWLTNQPEPRVWVSDGGVTGVNDTPAVTLRQFCLNLLVKHKIIQVNNIPQCLDLLKHKINHLHRMRGDDTIMKHHVEAIGS